MAKPKGGKRPGAGRKKKPKREESPQERLERQAKTVGLQMVDVEGETPRQMLERYMRGAQLEWYTHDQFGSLRTKADEDGVLKPITYWAPLPMVERLNIAKSLLHFTEAKCANKPPPQEKPGEGLSEEVVSWVDALTDEQLHQLERLVQDGAAKAATVNNGHSSSPRKR